MKGFIEIAKEISLREWIEAAVLVVALLALMYALILSF